MAITLKYTERIVDVNDVISNFSGVLLGYAIFRIFLLVVKKIANKDAETNSLITYIIKLQ